MNSMRAVSDPYTLQLMQIMSVSDSVPGKADALNQLGDVFKERFQAEKDPFDIGIALMAYETAVDLTPRTHRNYPLFLYDIGTAYRLRFEALGAMEDINNSISTHHSVADLLTPDNGSYPIAFTGLGNAYLRRFQHKGDMEDIDEAIRSLKTAESFTPEDDSEYPLVQNDLAGAFLCRSQFNHSIDDIQNALISYTRALGNIPSHHPMVRSVLRSMGNAFQSRFQVEGNLEDLEDAVRAHRSAVALTPQGHWGLPLVLDDLGGSLLCRFQRLGKKEDLDEVVSLRRHAVSLADDDTKSQLDEYLHTLAITLSCQFQQYGRLADIDEAVKLLRRARSLVDNGKIIRVASVLHDLATCLGCRFAHSRNLSDINQAIVLLKEAIALTPSDHTRIAERRTSLGNAYQSRFEHSRELADIDMAISLHQEAINDITTKHDPRFLFLLSNIALAYFTRFQHTADFIDLSIAHTTFQTAVNITPEGSSDLPTHLTNLAISEMSFSNHDVPSTRLLHAERAIESLSKVLDLLSDDHSTKPKTLANLAGAYSGRFTITKDMKDIDASIRLGRQALAGTKSEPSASRISILLQLGSCLRTRFKESKDSQDIEEAVRLLGDAESGVPKLESYEDLTSLYAETGRAHSIRYQENRNEEDYSKAVVAFRKALMTTSSAPVRLSSTLTWASFAFSHKPSDALEPYKAALDLLSQIVWLGQPMVVRHSRIPAISHVAREAAAAAISLGEYELALEWLEQGRGIIWSQFDHLRTSFEDVKKIDENLGEELNRVARALDASTFRATEAPFWKDATNMHDQVKTNHELARTWEGLVDKVRQLSGFEEFLKPPTFNQLVKSLQVFPVVVLNIHAKICEALILTGNRSAPIIHVPLKSFNLEKASNIHLEITSCLRSTVAHSAESDARAGKLASPKKNSMKGALLELWVSLVKPIVDALGYRPQADPPRIWWCPTGPLSFLPIHAAGDYDSVATVPGSVLSDYVVSSYLPTLSLGMRPTSDQSQSSFRGLLVVSQASAPSLPPLPNVQKEVRVIQKQFPPPTPCTNLDGKAATIDAVLDNMEKYSWVHFACHASQDTTFPALSGFHLHDGCLSFSTLFRKNIPGADFAYLSACQTVEGDEHLSEEAMHLAGGMLAVGYRSVIATMWSIGDDEAPIVAQEVYKNIGRDSSRSAKALHDAIKKLRQVLGDGEGVMYKWMPYVHVGA